MIEIFKNFIFTNFYLKTYFYLVSFIVMILLYYSKYVYYIIFKLVPYKRPSQGRWFNYTYKNSSAPNTNHKTIKTIKVLYLAQTNKQKYQIKYHIIFLPFILPTILYYFIPNGITKMEQYIKPISLNVVSVLFMYPLCVCVPYKHTSLS